MKKILLSAFESGSGKTTITAALLRLLKEKGTDVTGIKCGPDYIDPMFHNFVLNDKNTGGMNVDIFLQGRDKAVDQVAGLNKEAAVFEGAMGYYDGIGGRWENSAYDIARTLDIPVILIVRPHGASLTLAALIKGIAQFKTGSGIKGVILNDCRRSLYDHLKPIIEDETGIEVLGYVPHMKEAVIESRHLGLITAGEVTGLSEKIALISEAMKKSVNIERLIAIMEDGNNRRVREKGQTERSESGKSAGGYGSVRIAVAYDSAFCFYYRSSLNALRKAGAKIVFFSPLKDRGLPKDIQGLYIGGGYPELYLKELSDNISMKKEIKTAIDSGLPTIAECGGFMYLNEGIFDRNNEEKYEMVGIIRGNASFSGKLKRFGYIYLENNSDKQNMLFNEGERIPAHEFHYYDSDDSGEDLSASKALGNTDYRCGFINGSLYAGYPHLELSGEIPLAERFVERAVRYGKQG
ncbi:MAG: cobyrinate a,c-diamide synthase [Lachnospiraceae bacterium]|nr:cobyrinate a,c-diamide synthase [Lachnospiraceae bacterium]